MRRVLIQVLKIIISAFLIGWLLHRIGSEKLFTAIKDVDPLWFTGALVLFMASHFLGSLQWWYMLQAEEVIIPYSHVFRFYFVGMFFNNFLIGGVGGDVCRMMDIRHYSKNSAAAVSTVFLDRVMGLLVLSTMAVLSSPFYLMNHNSGLRYRWFILILAVAWIFTLTVLFSRRIARPFAWFVKRMVPEKVHVHAKEVYVKVHAFGRKRTLFLRVLLISFVVQLARIFVHFLVGSAVGIHVSPLYFIAFIPIIAIMAALPVSLGGIGIREQTGILLFAKAGIGDVQAFSMEFLAFIASIISSLPGGVFFILRKTASPESDKS